MRVEAWRVHDTGLVAAPGPFRRLAGLVRHHQGGEAWPARVVLEVTAAEVAVSSAEGEELARWPRREVTTRRVSAGPPVSFVVQVPGASHLLAAPADPSTDELLAALSE